jgi:hypothetical protein
MAELLLKMALNTITLPPAPHLFCLWGERGACFLKKKFKVTPKKFLVLRIFQTKIVRRRAKLFLNYFS